MSEDVPVSLLYCDALLSLLQHLPVDALVNAAAVCRSWRHAVDNQALWRDVCLGEGLLSTGAGGGGSGLELNEHARLCLARRQAESVALHLNLKVRISQSGLESLAASLPALRGLDLRQCCNASDGAVQAFAQVCPQLQSLTLASCPKVSDEAIAHLSGLPLAELDISLCEISDDGLAALAPLPLRSLVMQECKLPTAAGLCRLGALGSLRELDLTATPTCDESLDHLCTTLPLLEVLSLAFCSRIADVSCLQRLRNLKKLGLAGCRLECFEEAADADDAAAAEQLSYGWPHLGALEELSLMWCAIGDVEILGVSRRLPSLRWLDVSWTMVTAPGAAAVCRQIASLDVKQVRLTPGLETPPTCDETKQ